MEHVKIESRYLKFCFEIRAFFKKAAFYRPDFQKFLLIKKLGLAFASKHATEPLKYSPKLLKHLVKLLKHSPNF